MLEKEFKEIHLDYYIRIALFYGLAFVCLILGLVFTILTGALAFITITFFISIVIIVLEITLKEFRKPKLIEALEKEAINNTQLKKEQFEIFDFSMVVDEEYSDISDFISYDDAVFAFSLYGEKLIGRIYRLSSKNLPQENDQLKELLANYEYKLVISDLYVYLYIKGKKSLSFDPREFKKIDEYYQRFVFEEEIMKKMIEQSK